MVLKSAQLTSVPGDSYGPPTETQVEEINKNESKCPKTGVAFNNNAIVFVEHV